MNVFGLDFGHAGIELAHTADGVPVPVLDPARPGQARHPALVSVEKQVAWVGTPARDRLLDLPRIAFVGPVAGALGTEDILFTDDRGRNWQPPGLAALGIRKVLLDYLRQHPVRDACVVAALPAGASEEQAKALRTASRLAGFAAVELVDAPVAVCLAVRAKADELLLVLDAGAGPATASLVHAGPGGSGFTLLGTLRSAAPVARELARLLPAPLCRAGSDDGTPSCRYTEQHDRIDLLWDALHQSGAAQGLARDGEHMLPYAAGQATLRDANALVADQLLELARALLDQHEGSVERLGRVVCAGGWGRSPGVVRLLDARFKSQLRPDLQVVAAPAGAVSGGAALWHVRGHSRLQPQAPHLIGIRVQVQGQTRIEPVIRPGTALPASSTFPLYSARKGQTRLVFELARIDEDGQDESLGFFTLEVDDPLEAGQQLHCTVTLSPDGSVQAEARLPTGEVREAVLGTGNLEDLEGFQRHLRWIREVGINDLPADA